MGRWTQFDEDSACLPEGVKRIGYDADTYRYSFSDREGNVYLGLAHEEYGSLTLVDKSTRSPAVANDRPNAFASEDSRPNLLVDVQSPGSGSTFHDILPAHLITSPSSAESTPTESPIMRWLRRRRFPGRRATCQTVGGSNDLDPGVAFKVKFQAADD
ncbi:hypothetical protein B0H11DRAFT_2250323 [Mycena galericulata]|nr:hypothetical protein B0H11DRAFT_2250323 [Mycena galericulata]